MHDFIKDSIADQSFLIICSYILVTSVTDIFEHQVYCSLNEVYFAQQHNGALQRCQLMFCPVVLYSIGRTLPQPTFPCLTVFSRVEVSHYQCQQFRPEMSHVSSTR